MLEDDKNLALRVDTAAYDPPTVSGPGRIDIDFHVNREYRNRPLLRDATNLLGGDLDQVAATVEQVATRHLRETTGTNAQILWDGYTVNIKADVPAATEHNTEHAAHSPTEETGRPLNATQSAALPELVKTINSVLPSHERHHTETLALLIARELPSQAAAVHAWDRTTLAEVLDHHERRMETFTEPTVPPPLKLSQLSFPHHPSSALHHSAASTAAAPPGNAVSPRIHVDLER